MGISLPIVLYTHTDMEDVWPMAFGQIQKYLPKFTIYLTVNKVTDSIPSHFKTITYDDTLAYTDRWKTILPQIPDEIILFLHEDMILLGEPKIDLLNEYVELIASQKIRSVKLIFAGTGVAPSFIHPTLVSNGLSKLSIQPTIISNASFLYLLDMVGSKNIWDFESAITSNLGDFMALLGTEQKRGMFHYDSVVFPYIATAISKGKWNYSEYKSELDTLFTEYNIDPTIRGTV
jgi:hypothetical protein